MERFEAVLQEARGGGAYVEVPGAVVAALGGGGRIPVQATSDGVEYRGSIASMGGCMVLGVLKAPDRAGQDNRRLADGNGRAGYDRAHHRSTTRPRGGTGDRRRKGVLRGAELQPPPRTRPSNRRSQKTRN